MLIPQIGLSLIFWTVVINLISNIIVPPISDKLAKKSASKRLVLSGIAAGGSLEYIYKPFFRKARFVTSSAAREMADKMAFNHFMIINMLVCGVGGFIAGSLGYRLIGIPLNKKGILGLGAFVVFSFLGVWVFHASEFWNWNIGVGQNQLAYESPPKPTTPPDRPIISRPDYPEQPLPYNGEARLFTPAQLIAPFEIMSAQGNHYLIKLVNAYTKAPVMTIFVRGGTTMTTDVPVGVYEARLACGKTWYGYTYLFGPDTSYSKLDKTLEFKILGNEACGCSITLYGVPQGNLYISNIKPGEF